MEAVWVNEEGNMEQENLLIEREFFTVDTFMNEWIG